MLLSIVNLFWIVDFVSIMKKSEKSEMLFRRSNVHDVEFSIGEVENEDGYGKNEVVSGRKN